MKFLQALKPRSITLLVLTVLAVFTLFAPAHTTEAANLVGLPRTLNAITLKGDISEQNVSWNSGGIK